MFAGVGQLAALHHLGRPDGKPKTAPAPMPLQFPDCAPQAPERLHSSARDTLPLARVLQSIHRPTDIQLKHFETVGVHVISDANPRDIIPDPAFLPPSEEWLSVPPDEIEQRNEGTKKLLNNGKLSPGIKTYIERRNELSVDNAGAFRTVLRLPTPAGESTVRLGNAYAFFKHLEQISTFWYDTSNPKPADEPSTDASSIESTIPAPQANERTGPGSSPLHAEYRQQLVTAFIKMVAYDFGCNVAFARCEPRLHLKPSPPSPPSYFNSSASFIHRIPSDAASTRSGIIEGPVAAISSRATTVFAGPGDSNLDFGRELVAVLLTAQQRAREGTAEKRFGADEWWTTKPRWGGGPGGPIGREADTPEEASAPMTMSAAAPGMSTINEIKRAIGGINGAVTGKRPRRSAASHLYENYRKMLPPSSGWDRRARYAAIGKARASGADDVFLVSALNHHISIVRARVPDALLGALEGRDGEWERLVMWRSRWFDLFLKEDRVQSMELIWGMMAWLMRSEEGEKKAEKNGHGVGSGEDGKMDLT